MLCNKKEENAITNGDHEHESADMGMCKIMHMGVYSSEIYGMLINS